jgi:hypothetical protein
MCPPHWVKSVQSVQKKRPGSVLRVFASRLNAKARLLSRAFFISTSIVASGGKLNFTFGEFIFWFAGDSFWVVYWV